ncbi:hypothetical protein BH11ARM2_BH11ARM2_10090 [soil metagenome]
MSRKLDRGTTLVEVLVVIVVFLVGILAVVQIFPRGFQILTLTRKGSEATALSRDESERIKAAPSEIPEFILPVDDNGAGFDPDDTMLSPDDLGPAGNGIRADGVLMDGNKVVGPWQLYSGANRFRRIMGETRRVPAPRRVGGNASLYGGLLMANYGPIDTNYPLMISGNDLTRNPSPPAQLQERTDITATGMRFFDVLDTLGSSDFYLDTLDSTDPAIYVPVGTFQRQYRLTLSVLVSNGGQPVRRTLRGLAFTVPAVTISAQYPRLPLARIALAAPIASLLPSGDTYRSIYPDTIRVKRGYKEVPVGNGFSADPFEVKVLDLTRGMILFNPAGYSETVDGSDGRQPLSATLDYTVADWRILREDFRLTDSDNGHVKLSLAPLKGGVSDADGLTTSSLGPMETGNSQIAAASHLFIVDLDTGGIVCEKEPTGSTTPLITVNKSLGLVTFADASRVDGRQIRILLPDGAVRTFDLRGRALRAFYMSRDEFAVQVLKPASTYNASVIEPGPGEFYVGGSNGAIGGQVTRLYFPRSDAGSKVNIGVLRYLDASSNVREIVGQDFTVRFRPGENNPSIDLTDVDSGATGFDPNSLAARDVRGSSLTVRTLWNPDFFSLTSNPATNLTRLDQWARGYRRSTVQTYVARGEDTQ